MSIDVHSRPQSPIVSHGFHDRNCIHRVCCWRHSIQRVRWLPPAPPMPVYLALPIPSACAPTTTLRPTQVHPRGRRTNKAHKKTIESHNNIIMKTGTSHQLYPSLFRPFNLFEKYNKFVRTERTLSRCRITKFWGQLVLPQYFP